MNFPNIRFFVTVSVSVNNIGAIYWIQYHIVLGRSIMITLEILSISPAKHLAAALASKAAFLLSGMCPIALGHALELLRGKRDILKPCEPP